MAHELEAEIPGLHLSTAPSTPAGRGMKAGRSQNFGPMRSGIYFPAQGLRSGVTLTEFRRQQEATSSDCRFCLTRFAIPNPSALRGGLLQLYPQNLDLSACM